VRVVEWDSRRSKVKVNPLAAWTQADVEQYAEKHSLLVNPLLLDGYASIGCGPCTRRVDPGEDSRAGRWSGLSKVECGIHA
jgi:phosphoadenosine phosphosulfate reductase